MNMKLFMVAMLVVLGLTESKAQAECEPGQLPPGITQECGDTPGSTGLCGDGNNDGGVNILDITAMIAYLYMGQDPAGDLDCMNVDDVCGGVNILDITYMISYLYQAGPPPFCVDTDLFNFNLNHRATGQKDTASVSALLDYSMQLEPEGYTTINLDNLGEDPFQIRLPVDSPTVIHTTDIEFEYYSTSFSGIRHLQLQVPLTSDNFVPVQGTSFSLDVYESANVMHIYTEEYCAGRPCWNPYPDTLNLVIDTQYDSIPDELEDDPIGAADLFVSEYSEMNVTDNMELISNNMYFYTTGNRVGTNNPDRIGYTLFDSEDNLLCTGEFSPDYLDNSLQIVIPEEPGGACIKL